MASDTCISTVDCKLQKVILDKNMFGSIISLNRKITEILWNVSYLSNYVILHLLNNNKEMPNIDRSFFFALIYSITSSGQGKEKKLSDKIKQVIKHIQYAINDYKKLNYPKLDRQNCSDILEVIVKDNFIQNSILSVSTNFFDIQKSYICVQIIHHLNSENINLSKYSLMSLSSNICKFINGPSEDFNFKNIGLFFASKNHDDKKWTTLKKTLFKWKIKDKLKLIGKIIFLCYKNKNYIDEILNKINSGENKKIINKISNSVVKKNPHLFLKYLHNINKFYEKNKPKFISPINSLSKNKFNYNPDSRETNKVRPNKENNKKSFKKSKNDYNNSEDDFDEYKKCKKFMKCRNILPIRTGLPCFITLSAGDRMKNLIRHHLDKNDSYLTKIRSNYKPKNELENKILEDIKIIYNKTKLLLRDINSKNYIKNVGDLIISIKKLKNSLDYDLKNNANHKTKKLVLLNKHIKKYFKKLDDSTISNTINYLIDNWLFVENNCADKKFLLNTVADKDEWWRSFFVLEKQFNKLNIGYMLHKKFYNKDKNVFDILGNYITTDGYQLKVQFLKDSNNCASNLVALYNKNYNSIRCGQKCNTLNNRGIFDLNDASINKKELVGRIIKGCDPGVANVLSWTETKINKKLEVDENNMKNTDKKITNGEYHNSWFKGPYKVLEWKWRKEYDVNKIFEELSKYSLKTSDEKMVYKYLEILYQEENYTKIKNYKYDRRRQKWRYKRLLGKRSYIDKITNDLAYGIPIKKYGRERITYETNKKEPAIIMFGAANYKTSMRNYSAVPKKSILRVLAQKTLVFLTSEYNTTKNCFKCGDKVKSIENTCEKKIGDRFFKKWSKSNLRDVRYCTNNSCVTGDKLNRFYIGRDVNAANNILQNGLKYLSGESNL